MYEYPEGTTYSALSLLKNGAAFLSHLQSNALKNKRSCLIFRGYLSYIDTFTILNAYKHCIFNEGICVCKCLFCTCCLQYFCNNRDTIYGKIALKIQTTGILISVFNQIIILIAIKDN